MRYFVRDKIFDMLPTFIEAIDYINDEPYESANLVIEDLKSGLNSIQMTFNESFTAETSNEYDRIISQIEQQLMHIEENKIQVQPTDGEADIFKQLLNELELKLKNEREVKLEILFISYKYSMWDSLESIWLATEDDSRCNARVMPIPYYDRDENGLLGEFHYEIEEYIKNDIPVVSYKDYDYTVVRPDIIYFHNPYDGENRVTSVAPEFYSDKLKQYTDMLVYVPYYIATSFSLDNNKNGLIYTSGVLNSDKVIVQSQALKEVYINNEVPEDKIEVFGSPKIDYAIKALNQKEEKNNELKGFENKKVILLNSSIGDLLNVDNYFEQLKEKVSKILAYKEFAVLWRPHPLLKTTIDTLRPSLKKQFNNFKHQFLKNNNFIIDDSIGINRAIKHTDVLMTDFSSLIHSYIMTKKPIYIFNRSSHVKNNTVICSDITKCYFEEDLTLSNFLNVIIEGEDSLKEQRYNQFVQSIENSDGMSGKHIHNFISELLV